MASHRLIDLDLDALGDEKTKSLTKKACIEQDLPLRISARDVFDLEWCATHGADAWITWPAVREREMWWNFFPVRD